MHDAVNMYSPRHINNKHLIHSTKQNESPLMNLPILLLLRPKSRQSPIPPLLPRNLNHNKSHKIRQRPVTTMRTEHIQILDIQRAPTPRKKVVDLSVVVEQEHALFGDLFAREVVCF